uniref:Head to tail adaptor n=1 Tax=Siphoviridae sp. ctKNZ79 TaxID=2825440 RepID=A0A8S5U9G9_9CAUD|nr:MAG TPA: head to tail adaptor [Siphoviridae sp. ctKNZ79]
MALMEDALAYLQITWKDKTLQRKLEGGIERGKVLLEEYAGTTLNFDVPGTPQALLFDYLRYVRSDATEMFEINYQRDLMRLRNLYGVNGEELEE